MPSQHREMCCSIMSNVLQHYFSNLLRSTGHNSTVYSLANPIINGSQLMMIFLSLDGEALLDDFISPLKQDSVVVQRF